MNMQQKVQQGHSFAKALRQGSRKDKMMVQVAAALLFAIAAGLGVTVAVVVAETVAQRRGHEIGLSAMLRVRVLILFLHVDDACAELAGDAGDFALYVGIVSAFIEAALEEPMGEEAQADQQGQKQGESFHHGLK